MAKCNYCTNVAMWDVLYRGGTHDDLCDFHASEVKASGEFGTITRNGLPRHMTDPEAAPLRQSAPKGYWKPRSHYSL